SPGARKVHKGFAAVAACDCSVDLDLAGRGRGLLREHELQDAVGETGHGFRLVELHGKREAARALAAEALGAQPLAAFLRLGLATGLGRQRYLVALDIEG